MSETKDIEFAGALSLTAIGVTGHLGVTAAASAGVLVGGLITAAAAPYIAVGAGVYALVRAIEEFND